jgi:hypothetical protein
MTYPLCWKPAQRYDGTKKIATCREWRLGLKIPRRPGLEPGPIATGRNYFIRWPLPSFSNNDGGGYGSPDAQLRI